MKNTRHNKQEWIIIEEFLMEDKGIRKTLDEMILEKFHELKKLEKEAKKFKNSNAYEELGDFAPEFRAAIVNYLYGTQIKEKYRILFNMIQTRERYKEKHNKTKKPISKTNWEQIYQFSTQKADIIDVISHFIDIKNPRKNISCPFNHEDKNPSFRIYENDNFFICYSCGRKGNPINFVMQFTNCSFKEAVIQTYRMFNHNLIS